MVIVFLSTLHPLLVFLVIISQLWRILILLTKLFPNCWLPIAFLDRRSCPITSTLSLSVSVQSSGKKRLILDLRFVNRHVRKQKVKFEDLKVALIILTRVI